MVTEDTFQQPMDSCEQASGGREVCSQLTFTTTFLPLPEFNMAVKGIASLNNPKIGKKHQTLDPIQGLKLVWNCVLAGLRLPVQMTSQPLDC